MFWALPSPLRRESGLGRSLVSAENGGPSREGWGTPWLAEACLASDGQSGASNLRAILLLLGCVWFAGRRSLGTTHEGAGSTACSRLDWRTGPEPEWFAWRDQGLFASTFFGPRHTEQRQNPRYLRVLVSRRRGQVDHDFRDEQTGAKPGPRPPFLGCFWGLVQVPGPQHRYSVLSLAVVRLKWWL